MGMRVSLTLLALAHGSMMSSDASWIGFFMYPTLISRSWARLAVNAGAIIAAAAAARTPIAKARGAAPRTGRRRPGIELLLTSSVAQRRRWATLSPRGDASALHARRPVLPRYFLVALGPKSA